MKKKYDKTVMQKAQEVFLVMSKRVSGKDMVRIREAFEFACEAHADQKRKSGEPYIIHPIEVASIVAGELELVLTLLSRPSFMMWWRTRNTRLTIFRSVLERMSLSWWVF